MIFGYHEPMTNKTVPTEQDPRGFLDQIENANKRSDAHQLLELFKTTTGWNPVMWGPSIIGFGQYHYKYESGREGDFLATGFSPRKANFSVYIMPGYKDFGAILDRIGKHKTGASCLYFNKLADIDQTVLAELITAGLEDLATRYAIKPS